MDVSGTGSSPPPSSDKKGDPSKSPADPPSPALPHPSAPTSAQAPPLAGRVTQAYSFEKVRSLVGSILPNLQSDDTVDWASVLTSDEFRTLTGDELFVVISEIISDTSPVKNPANFSSLLSEIRSHPAWSTLKTNQLISLHSLAASSFIQQDRAYLKEFLHATWETPLLWSNPIGGLEYNNLYQEYTGFKKYLAEFISFKRTHPDSRIDLKKLLYTDISKYVTYAESLELLDLCKDLPELRFITITWLAGRSSSDYEVRKNLCLEAIKTGDIELYKQCFPFHLLTNEEKLDDFIKNIVPKIHERFDLISPEFKDIINSSFKFAIYRSPKSGEALIHLLYLQTFSSVSRFEDRSVIELEGSHSREPFYYQLEALQKYRDTLAPSDPKRGELDRLITELEDSSLGFLVYSSLDVTPIDDLFRDYTLKKAHALKPGEKCVLPYSFFGEEGAHAVLIEVSRQTDDKYTLRTYNTGNGIYHHPCIMEGPIAAQKFYPYEKNSIPLDGLDDLLTQISSISKQSKTNGKKTDENMAEFYSALGRGAGKERDPRDTRLRPYKQQNIGNCAFKSISTWIHSQLSEETYTELKVHSQKLLLAKLKEAIENEKARLFSKLGHPPTDEEVIMSLFPSISPPSRVLEILKLGERETLYTETKKTRLASMPIDEAFTVLERNPHDLILLEEFLLHKDIKSLSASQLAYVLELIYLTDNLDRIEELKSSYEFSDASDQLQSNLKKLIHEVKSSTSVDLNMFVKAFFLALYLDPSQLDSLLTKMPPLSENPHLITILLNKCERVGNTDMIEKLWRIHREK